MTIETLWMDGFDHYDTAHLLSKWSGYTSSPPFTIDTAQSRNGSQSLKVGNSSSGNHQIFKTLPMQSQTLVVGFGFRPGTSGDANRGGLILGSGGVDLSFVGKSQIVLHYQSSNQLAVRLAGTGTGMDGGMLLGTSTTVLSPGTWYHVGLRVYLHGSAGEWELWINGVSEASGTGVNTQQRSGTYLDVIGFDNPAGGGSNFFHIDDLYIRGDTANTAGGFLGDCKVLTRLVQGAGNYAQLTPSGAASNYEAVDDMIPDDDTTYVHTNTTGHKDTFDMAALSDSGSILAVQTNICARKTEAGNRLIEPLWRIGGTDYFADEQGLSTGYLYNTKVYEINPATGLAFSANSLDASDPGYRAA